MFIAHLSNISKTDSFSTQTFYSMQCFNQLELEDDQILTDQLRVEITPDLLRLIVSNSDRTVVRLGRH
jgi:hypothetical protein